MQNPEMARRIGLNVQHQRSLRGISVQQEADLVGTSLDNMYKYESGKRDMTVAFAYKLADAIGCNVLDLITNVNGEDLPELPHPLRATAPDEKQILRDLAARYEGDTRLLIITIGLLSKFREDDLTDILMQISIAAEQRIDPELLPPGMDYFREQLGKRLGGDRP